MPVYEVWCHACNVTFPPEARRCLHCGGRLQPDPPGRRLRERPPREFELPPMGFGEPARLPPQEAAGPQPTLSTRPAGSGAPGGPVDAGDLDEEPVRRSLLRAGMTVLWMVLLAAGYAWRACSQ